MRDGHDVLRDFIRYEIIPDVTWGAPDRERKLRVVIHYFDHKTRELGDNGVSSVFETPLCTEAASDAAKVIIERWNSLQKYNLNFGDIIFYKVVPLGSYVPGPFVSELGRFKYTP